MESVLSILEFVLIFYIIGMFVSFVSSICFTYRFKLKCTDEHISFIILSILLSWISILCFIWMFIDYVKDQYEDYKFRKSLKIFKNDR